MTFEETLHVAHKERLARIARAAQTPKIKNPTKPTKPAILEAAPRRDIFDPEAERAWMIEIEGLNPVGRSVNGRMVNDIIHMCCLYFNITRDDFLGRRRLPDLVLPRQVASWLCHQLTTASLPEIARNMGGRDHSTIHHSVRLIETRRRVDDLLQDTLEQLARQCGVGKAVRRPKKILSENDVRAIRASNAGDVDLAARYGVMRQTIYLVRSGRTWRGLA